MKKLSALLLTAALPARAATYANPIDIDYRYNFEDEAERVSYRTGADPAIVRHGRQFYLFETLADGYWRSPDLVRWTFVHPNLWPFESMVAPAAWSDGRRLYLMPARMQAGAILVSDAPETGRWSFLIRRGQSLPGAVMPGQEDHLKTGQFPPGPWDPALFRDDDARWYLYWGSSNVFPIFGIQLDPAHQLAYVGRPKPLIALDPVHHGWERFGQDQSGRDAAGHPIDPFIEGAWMTKVGGRYYLQYAAPGTEFNAYANGTYVGRTPLGPFAYASYNPVAYKPGGFVVGAGHGSTVEDAHGNWWNSGTSWIGLNSAFERRITLFPARFYPDGQMAVSTRFGDFPLRMPTAKVEDADGLFTGWMLLSYRKRAVASSTAPGFDAPAVTDENARTFWVAGANRAGETLTIDLARVEIVRAIQVNFADYHAARYGDAPDIYTAFRLQGSVDGRRWMPLADTGRERRDRPNAYFELAKPARVRFVRYVHGHVGSATLAIADLRAFGTASGLPPAAPALDTAARSADTREARIRWQPVPGAVGYNVRWGIRPDRLTLTYQLFADKVANEGNRAALTLRSLNTGQRYWVAVEAFNESGVSRLSAVAEVR